VPAFHLLADLAQLAHTVWGKHDVVPAVARLDFPRQLRKLVPALVPGGRGKILQQWRLRNPAVERAVFCGGVCGAPLRAGDCRRDGVVNLVLRQRKAAGKEIQCAGAELKSALLSLRLPDYGTRSEIRNVENDRNDPERHRGVGRPSLPSGQDRYAVMARERIEDCLPMSQAIRPAQVVEPREREDSVADSCSAKAEFQQLPEVCRFRDPIETHDEQLTFDRRRQRRRGITAFRFVRALEVDAKWPVHSKSLRGKLTQYAHRVVGIRKIDCERGFD
jgi:hypothetical protein